MSLPIIITALVFALAMFGIGFVLGFYRGERSLDVRLKFALYRDEIARLKLALKGAQHHIDHLKQDKQAPIF